MGTRAMGTVEGKAWDEQPYGDIDGEKKLARADVTNVFRGDLEGEGSLVYLLAYGEGDFAGFVGLEQVVGRLGGRSGSFVLQHTGRFERGVVNATLSIVPGTATGELTGLRGDGSFVWDGQHGDPGRFTLDYDLG